MIHAIGLGSAIWRCHLVAAMTVMMVMMCRVAALLGVTCRVVGIGLKRIEPRFQGGGGLLGLSGLRLRIRSWI